MSKINHRRQNAHLAPLEQKMCAGCRKAKSFSEFHKTKNRKYGIQDYCKECRRETQKHRIRTNPEAYTKKQQIYRETERWKALFKQYGITKEEYESLEKLQDEKCAICNKKETFAVKGELMTEGTIRRLAVDHCHRTKKVRGLLCTRCNHGLGYFEDDCNVLKKAIAYLEKYKE